MNDRTCARVRVSNALLAEWLRGDFLPVRDSSAPADMRVIGVGQSIPGPAGWVEFIVWSETFAPIPDGGEHPLYAPTYRSLV